MSTNIMQSQPPAGEREPDVERATAVRRPWSPPRLTVSSVDVTLAAKFLLGVESGTVQGPAS
jgi:hypothetical protein